MAAILEPQEWPLDREMKNRRHCQRQHKLSNEDNYGIVRESPARDPRPHDIARVAMAKVEGVGNSAEVTGHAIVQVRAGPGHDRDQDHREQVGHDVTLTLEGKHENQRAHRRPGVRQRICGAFTSY